jgi:hypothetical protein
MCAIPATQERQKDQEFKASPGNVTETLSQKPRAQVAEGLPSMQDSIPSTTKRENDQIKYRRKRFTVYDRTHRDHKENIDRLNFVSIKIFFLKK